MSKSWEWLIEWVCREGWDEWERWGDWEWFYEDHYKIKEKMEINDNDKTYCKEEIKRVSEQKTEEKEKDDIDIQD